jgi:hypothetical protein
VNTPRLLAVRALTALALIVLSAFSTAAPAWAATPERPAQVGAPYSLMQMNLCLSGGARCYPDTEYPKILDEAVERIQENDVNAVTFNEACSGDVEKIAERTGYHMRFATVLYPTAPYQCKTPGGRGVFGNAVLTKEAIMSSQDAAYSRWNGSEQRRWLCVTTARGVDVCTTHLSTDGEADPASANNLQCGELRGVLKSRTNPTLFGGDMNRQASCAPEGNWSLTDDDAAQLPGIQHIYGNIGEPTLEIEGATYTDHDVMIARTVIPKP